MSSAPKVRVIVRLPYSRPEDAPPDPPKIEWTTEKENILWEVIARSRAADSGGTDWKGLAAHLQVPLPYLLYRAQTRYEQDLRGLQDIKGALSPTSAGQGPSKNTEYFPDIVDKPSLDRRASSRVGGGRLSSSTRLSTPIGGRARLSSLPSRVYKTSSSSTLTLRGPKRSNPPLSPPSPSGSSEDEEDSEEEAARAEKAEREAEGQEALERKLQDLQRMITNDTIGLIRSPVSPSRDKGKEVNRGRIGPLSPRLHPADSSSRAPPSDRSQSLSSAGSPQGSIPSIPSPPPESRRGSPMARHMSPSKSTSPPTVSHGNARGHPHMRYATMPVVAKRTPSERSSNHGSSASSFSDLSDASLSASALESALMSNIKGGGSKFSSFARSHLSGRKGMPH